MRRTSVLVLVVGMLVWSETTAEAYLDPGSGSMLVQLLLGGVAGVLVIINLLWRRLLDRLGISRQDRSNGAGRA